jgi:hypothetical protein
MRETLPIEFVPESRFLCLPFRLVKFLMCRIPIGKSFGNLDSDKRLGPEKLVTDLPTTAAQTEPQLPVAHLVLQELQH